MSNFFLVRNTESTLRLFTGLIVLTIESSAAGQSGYDLTWRTIDGGGGTSAGGTFELSGTIGQPDAARANEFAGGAYSLTGGFWAVPICSSFIAQDFDHDCDVDGMDRMAFEACGSGPTILRAAGCEGKDFDADGDVDQVDYGRFQRCYSGAGVAADPACAD